METNVAAEGRAFEVGDRGVDSRVGEKLGFENFPEGSFAIGFFAEMQTTFFVVLVGVALRSRITVAGVRECVGDGNGLSILAVSSFWWFWLDWRSRTCFAKFSMIC